MKILSLFDGISCARVALERAGFKVDAYYASEIDKYAIQIAQKNHPDTIQLGDINELVGVDGLRKWLPDIDLLIGGSPCQDLSIAKKDRKGLDGERSGLFWKYVEVLKYAKPKWFILENVNSMPKEAKEIITKTLGVEPIMINAALVSAQNRKRLFWTNIPNVKLPEDKGILLRDILEPKVDDSFTIKDKSNTIRTSGRGSGIDDKHNWDTIRIGSIGKGGQGKRIYSIEGKSVTLSAGSSAGGEAGQRTGIYAIIPEATKKGYAIAEEGNSVDLSFPNSKTRRGRVGDKAKNIMTSQSIGVFTEGIIRKLTPIECERLQCLPDNYTEGVSTTQRYRQLGNAFNVDVVSWILSFIPKVDKSPDPIKT